MVSDTPAMTVSALWGHDCGQGCAAAGPATAVRRSVTRQPAASGSPCIAFPDASRQGGGTGGQPGGSPAPGQQPGTGPPSRCLPKTACVASASLKDYGYRVKDRDPGRVPAATTTGRTDQQAGANASAASGLRFRRRLPDRTQPLQPSPAAH